MNNNMRKSTLVMAMVIALAMSTMAGAFADGHVTPSTNDDNRNAGWAHFDVVDDTIPGQVTVEFISTRGFLSCFEYRSDGEDPTYEQPNFNDDIIDGLWSFTCVNNSTDGQTLFAEDYVEIRMVFGAERDERFDWTQVDVTPIPSTKDDCKDGGWETFGDFRNQGQCVSSFQANERAGK